MNNEFSLGLPEIGHHLGFVHVYGQRSKGFQALLHGIATAKTKHVSIHLFKYILFSCTGFIYKYFPPEHS
jgi:hypothetical protein